MSNPTNFLFGKNKGGKKPPVPASSGQSTSFAGNQQNTPSKRLRNPDDEDNQHQNKRVDDKNTPESKMRNLESGEQKALTDNELTSVTSQLFDDGTATTYAAAAKKPQVDPQLVVYFHRTDQRREPCQKVDFDSFMKAILEKIASDSNIMNILQLDWSGYSMGRGIIACLNEKSIKYLKVEASKFTVTKKSGEVNKFRIWSKREFGSRDIFSGMLFGKTFTEQKGLDVLRWVLTINGLREHKPTLIMYQKIKDGRGIFLKIEADSALTEALIKKGLILQAGICRLRLDHKHVEAIAESGADLDEDLLEEEEEEKNSSTAASAAATSKSIAESGSTNVEKL